MKKFIENIKLLKKETKSNIFKIFFILIKNKNNYNLTKQYLLNPKKSKRKDLLDKLLKKLETKKDKNKAASGLYKFLLYLKEEGFVVEDIIIFMMMVAIVTLLCIQIYLINHAYK